MATSATRHTISHNITTTAEARTFLELLQKDQSIAIQIVQLSIELHPENLPLGEDHEGLQNRTTLVEILSCFARAGALKHLSLSCPPDGPGRFNWRTIQLADGNNVSGLSSLVSALSLEDWRMLNATVPELHVSGLNNVPASTLYTWMCVASALTLEYVMVDYSTFKDLVNIPPKLGQYEALQRCSLKLRNLEMATFSHFHRCVMGTRSPLLDVKSVTLWIGGSLRNEVHASRFLGNGTMSPTCLEDLGIIRCYNKTVSGNVDAESLGREYMNVGQTPTIKSLSLQALVEDTNDVAFYRKVIKSLLKSVVSTLQIPSNGIANLEQLTFILVDGQNVGATSLLYHSSRFVETFRDAFQRPGNRIRWFNQHYPRLTSVRVVVQPLHGRITAEDKPEYEAWVEEMNKQGDEGGSNTKITFAIEPLLGTGHDA